MAVFGSRHQADTCYKGSGTQCTVNVLVAMVTAYVKSPEKWDTGTVDEILQNGDNLHSTLVKPRTSPYFLVDELPKNYDQYEIQYSQPVTGSVFQNGASMEDPYCNLDVILDVAKTASSAFLTIGASSPSYTIGLIFNGDKTWVFDSHSRGADGMCAPNGTAALTEHKNEFLVDFIRKLSSSLNMDDSCPFELISIKVKPSEPNMEELISDLEESSSFSGFDEEDINIKVQQNISPIKTSDSDSSLNEAVTAKSDSSSENLPLAYLKASRRMPADELKNRTLSSIESEFSTDDDIPLAQSSFHSDVKYKGTRYKDRLSEKRKTEHGLSTSELSSTDSSNKTKKPLKRKKLKRNKCSKPSAKNRKEPKGIVESENKSMSSRESDYSSGDDIPLAQSCFYSDIESSGSEYKFTKLEQKQIEQGLSTSELSDSEFSDSDQQKKRAKKSRKQSIRVSPQNKPSAKSSQQWRKAVKSTEKSYTIEHSYCAPSFSESFPPKEVINESNTCANENTGYVIDGTFDSGFVIAGTFDSGFVIDGTFDSVDSEQYLAQVRADEESSEFMVSEAEIYKAESQNVNTEVFTGYEDPMVSGRRGSVSDVNFEEQTKYQFEQGNSDSEEKGNTFTCEILTPDQEDLDFENSLFVDEFGNQLFFEQVSSEISSHTAFDNQGERGELEDQCEEEKTLKKREKILV